MHFTGNHQTSTCIGLLDQGRPQVLGSRRPGLGSCDLTTAILQHTRRLVHLITHDSLHLLLTCVKIKQAQGRRASPPEAALRGASVHVLLLVQGIEGANHHASSFIADE